MLCCVKTRICTLKQYSHLSSDILEECKHDPGGYFIINGSEKTVLIQERAAENRVFCHTSKKTKWSMVAEVKSVPDYKKISPKQAKSIPAAFSFLVSVSITLL